VARHPEILDFPKPRSATKHHVRYYQKLRKRIVELVESKILCGKVSL
jgi:hypothetical protein